MMRPCRSARAPLPPFAMTERTARSLHYLVDILDAEGEVIARAAMLVAFPDLPMRAWLRDSAVPPGEHVLVFNDGTHRPVSLRSPTPPSVLREMVVVWAGEGHLVPSGARTVE